MKDVKTVDMNHLTPEQILEEITKTPCPCGDHPHDYYPVLSVEKLAAFLAQHLNK